MLDALRVAFLVLTDVVVVALLIVLAMLIVLLSGCVATPSRYQDRNGDFIMNIGSGDKVSPVLASATVSIAP